MEKFKKGDKVVRTTSDYYGVVKGRVYTVRYQTGYDIFIEEHSGGFDITLFELVKPFTKSDLKNKSIVTLRNGRMYRFCHMSSILYCENNIGRIHLSNYSEDLTSCAVDPVYDIVKVEEQATVFQRTEPSPKQLKVAVIVKQIEHLTAQLKELEVNEEES